MASRRQTELDLNLVNEISARLSTLLDTENLPEHHLEVILSLASMLVGVCNEFNLVSWFPYKAVCMAYDAVHQGSGFFADDDDIKKMMEENKRHES